MSSYIIDKQMFEQPGFITLYDAWSEVFSKDFESGGFKLSPEEAIKITKDAKKEVELSGVELQTIRQLESIACRYAQVMPTFIEERVENF